MKHLTKMIATCGVLALLAAPAQAADESMLKYGVVDMGRIIQKTEAAQGIFNDLESKRQEYQTQIKKEEETLETAEKEILKMKEKLPKEEFEKKAKEFQTKILNAQKMVQEKKKMLDDAYGRTMLKLREEAAKIIADVAKERGYSAVFTQDAVVIAAEGLDMTDEVITRLNKDVKKIPVEWSAPKKK